MATAVFPTNARSYQTVYLVHACLETADKKVESELMIFRLAVSQSLPLTLVFSRRQKFSHMSASV